MKRSNCVLAAFILTAFAGSAWAGASCGPGFHQKAGVLGAPCVPDAAGAKTTPYTGGGEFGSPAPAGASGAASALSDLNSQLSRYDALTALEKRRADYLKYKLLANELSNQLNAQSNPAAITTGPIPLYLTAVYGEPGHLSGTMLFEGSIWQVKTGTVLAPGVEVTDLAGNHASVNWHGTTRLLGLTSYAQIQSVESRQLGARGVGDNSSGAARPAIPITSSGGVGPLPRITPSDLPPPVSGSGGNG